MGIRTAWIGLAGTLEKKITSTFQTARFYMLLDGTEFDTLR
jgi:hypothetical protein